MRVQVQGETPDINSKKNSLLFWGRDVWDVT